MNALRPEPPSVLSALIGTWETRGATAGEPSETIVATDRYEWLEGGYFLRHYIDAKRPQALQALEIIGPRAASGAFPVTGFNSNGETYSSTCEVDGRAFRIFAPGERFAGTFSADGRALRGTWERSPDGRAWQPWMTIALTKVEIVNGASDTKMSPENEVRVVVENWAKAVADGDRTAILAHHADDMVMFDLSATVRGLDAYDRSWDFFYANPRGPISFVPRDMVVVGDNEVALAFCGMHCDGTSAGPVDFRLTTGLRKVDGEWMIVHEHHSVPTGAAHLAGATDAVAGRAEDRS